jgi:GT2 family glycosyltransferase
VLPVVFAVIPTRNRPDDLRDAVSAIRDQVDEVIVVDNGSQPPVREGTIIIDCDDDPPNISHLWNLGIEAGSNLATPLRPEIEWFVAVINDDCVVPPGWVDAVVSAMQATGSAAGCSDVHGVLTSPYHKVNMLAGDLSRRLCGFAFVLRGSSGLRFDESLQWWYSDDDMDWRAQQSGGVVIVPGFKVEHRWPNAQMNARPELSEQAGVDRATFVAKWGRQPW